MEKDLFIIGGGPSLKDVDFSLLEDKDTLVINRAIIDVPNPTYFITMDYTFYDRISGKTNGKMSKDDFQKLRCHKIFIVATDNDYIKNINGHYIDTRYDYRYILGWFDEVIESPKNIGIGRNENEFVHGCCSGYSALQYGLLMGYENIYLLGIDLLSENNSTHYHNDYGLNLRKFNERLNFYFPYFVIGLKDIKNKYPNKNVYSCSPISNLNSHIEYKPMQEIL